MNAKILDLLTEVQDRLAITKCNVLGNSTLAQIGNEELIIDILTEQVDCPELTTENQRSVLQYYLYTCCFWGFSDLVSKLLEFGADVNYQNSRTLWTPLHGAVFQEHSKVVQILLNGGARTDLKDAKRRSVVDFASLSSRVWHLFEEIGHSKTSKQHLIDLQVLKQFSNDDLALTPQSTSRELQSNSNRAVRSAQVEKSQRAYRPSWGSNDSSRIKAVFGGAE